MVLVLVSMVVTEHQVGGGKCGERAVCEANRGASRGTRGQAVGAGGQARGAGGQAMLEVGPLLGCSPLGVQRDKNKTQKGPRCDKHGHDDNHDPTNKNS